MPQVIFRIFSYLFVVMVFIREPLNLKLTRFGKPLNPKPFFRQTICGIDAKKNHNGGRGKWNGSLWKDRC